MSAFDELKTQLQKFGYTKFEDNNAKTEIKVFVAKSARNSEFADTLEKLKQYGAFNNLDVGGSLGRIEFKDTSSYNGLRILFKPDASADLRTDEHESLSAYFTAAKFNNPKTDYSLDDVKKVSIESSFSIDHLFNKANNAWIKSSILHAEKLHRHFKGNTYVLHHRTKSRFIKKLYDKAKELLTAAGKPRMSLDKWNPGDMWMVHSSYEDHDFSQYETIQELNTFLTEAYQDKKVIGVSLKQAVKTAKMEVKAYKPGFWQKEVTLDGFSYGKRSFLASTDSFIFFNSGAGVALRAFKTGQDVNAEITGRFAAGGKASLNVVEDILKECVGRNFEATPRSRDIKTAISRNQTKFIKDFYRKARKVPTTGLANISEDTFVKEVISKRSKMIPFLVSKFQAFNIVSQFEKAKKDDVECSVSKLISYAGSETELSSVYVKVYTR